MNRDELVERVALLVAPYMGCEDCGTGPGECPCRDLARAALAIIEPVVRDECARVAADYHNTVSYTHLTLPTIHVECRSRWSPYH